MKKLTLNTFTEGLMLDIHPLTVPNNVLTDALNATIITMNGNEFVLQNDMGNGRVEKAYLPSGYVPIGIKEYGGVIYVASYNPITNKGLIGSFPSPERNIDSEESTDIIKKITWGDFFDISDNKAEKCKTFVVKLELFGGEIIRSGDKFTIYFNEKSTGMDLLSNYYNTYDEEGGIIGNRVTSEVKVESPKKNVFNMYLAVLDSNNTLRNITKELKRFYKKEGENEEKILQFDVDVNNLDLVKPNAGFFILKPTSDDTDINDLFKLERQKRAVNTYNNKLFGKLYIVIELNIIDHIDVAIRGYRKLLEREADVEASGSRAVGTLQPDKGQWGHVSDLDYNKIGDALSNINDEVLLMFDTTYVYNCPDGFTEGAPINNNYKSYHGKYENSVILGIELEENIQKTESEENTSNKLLPGKLYLTFPDGKNYEDEPIYNEETDLYSITDTGWISLPLEGDSPHIFNYTITPWMTYSKLEALAVKGSINLDLLDTGDTFLTGWRYYCDNTKVKITWGCESYATEESKVSDMQFHIYEILYDTKKVGYIDIDPKSSYHGTFTLNVNYGEYGIYQNNLYLVVITYKRADREGKVQVAGYKWLLTNGLFNRLYINGVLDFSTLIADNPSTDDLYYNQYTTNNKEYERYEYAEGYKDLMIVELQNTINDKVVTPLTSNHKLGKIFSNFDDGDPGYLEAKIVTHLTLDVKINNSTKISTNYPFDLNEDAIEYTTELGDSELIPLTLDENLIGNPDNLIYNGEKIFTADKQFGVAGGDDLSKDSPKDPETEENNWLNVSINEGVISIDCGVHSQIAGLTIKGDITSTGIIKPYLEDNLIPVFKTANDYPDKSLAIVVDYHNVKNLTKKDDTFINILLGTYNSTKHKAKKDSNLPDQGTGEIEYTDFNPRKTLVYEKDKKDLYYGTWELGDYRDKLSEYILSELGNPIIASITGDYGSARKDDKPWGTSDWYGGAGLYTYSINNSANPRRLLNNPANQYTYPMWRTTDGSYVWVDLLTRSTKYGLRIIKMFLSYFYLYVEGTPKLIPIYKIDSTKYAYLSDFLTEILIKLTTAIKIKESEKDNLFTVQNTTDSYLEKLFSNTNEVLSSENYEIKLSDDELAKFCSEVWFVAKKQLELEQQLSYNLKIMGVLEYVSQLLALQNNTKAIYINGEIKFLDDSGLEFNGNTIYIVDKDGVNPILTIFPTLAGLLTLRPMNGVNQILVSKWYNLSSPYTSRNYYTSDCEIGSRFYMKELSMLNITELWEKYYDEIVKKVDAMDDLGNTNYVAWNPNTFTGRQFKDKYGNYLFGTLTYSNNGYWFNRNCMEIDPNPIHPNNYDNQYVDEGECEGET